MGCRYLFNTASIVCVAGSVKLSGVRPSFCLSLCPFIRPVILPLYAAACGGHLERGADLHTAQLMPLPLTVSCFSRIQIGFAFLVPAHPGSPGQRAVKRV